MVKHCFLAVLLVACVSNNLLAQNNPFPATPDLGEEVRPLSTGPNDNYVLTGILNAKTNVDRASFLALKKMEYTFVLRLGISEVKKNADVKPRASITSFRPVTENGFSVFYFGIPKSKMETASKRGISFTLSYTGGSQDFTIPAEQFAGILNQANEKLEKANAWGLALDGQKKRMSNPDRYTAYYTALEQQDGERQTAYFKQLTPTLSSDAVAYLKKGSGRIAGQAFLKTTGGEPKLASGNEIMLYPSTIAFCAVANGMDSIRKQINGSLPEETITTFKKIARFVTADAWGNFEFTDLPAGDYIIETNITWSYNNGYGMVQAGGRVWKRLTVPGDNNKVMLTW